MKASPKAAMVHVLTSYQKVFQFIKIIKHLSHFSVLPSQHLGLFILAKFTAVYNRSHFLKC